MENREKKAKKPVEDKEMKYFFIGVWGGAFLLCSFFIVYVKPLLIGLLDLIASK